MTPNPPPSVSDAIAVLREMRANLTGSPGHRCRTERRALDVVLEALASRRGEEERLRQTIRERDEARKQVARYEAPGGWSWLREREAARVLGDPTASFVGQADAGFPAAISKDNGHE